MITNILSFILVLGLLIFIHELGHFLLARVFGVGIETFSLGYGTRLFGKKVGRTDYRISLLPLGGYVKMVGEEPGSEIPPEDLPISFTHQHVVKRMLIVAAGPIFNIFLAIVLLFGLFQVSGLIMYQPEVGSVRAGGPADDAGLQTGDMILEINGIPVQSWDEITQLISESDLKPLSLKILREDNALVKMVTPERVVSQNLFGEDIERIMIGIGIGEKTFTRELSVIEAFAESIDRTYYITKLTFLSVIKLIQGTLSIKTLGGPIMIAEMAGQNAKAGMTSLTAFIALISINLAILNLLPIPVLDGGHLLFFFFELILRRPVSLRVREIAQQAGMFLLLVLMIYVIYNDISRLLFS